MTDGHKLLVVDDEPTTCQTCRQILERHGIEVEENTDPCQGLDWAKQKDYAGILLDIGMPSLDGIEFLKQLRHAKPDLPVLIMTGYPSIPNAAAAIRLGVSDYLTKPFAPEEMAEAVDRMLAMRRGGERADAAALAKEGAAAFGPHEDREVGVPTYRFLDSSWLLLESDGSATVGTVPAGLEEADVRSVRLPAVGEVVYQGLPLAGIRVGDRPEAVVHSPLSGVVAAVNEELAQHPEFVAQDPCGRGWLACVCTTRYREEAALCGARRVLLVNGDSTSARQQRARLHGLGCRIRTMAGREAATAAAAEPEDDTLIVLDAASFGEDGPSLVAEINAVAPERKVLVIACAEGRLECAYRQQRIFYYAMEPLADNEMADILDAAFRRGDPPVPCTRPARTSGDAIGSITVTNRGGRKVQLLAGPGLLWRCDGLGAEICERLTERMYPTVVTPGPSEPGPGDLHRAARRCDRLMVLRARDTGRLPGALARDTRVEIGGEPGEALLRITTLTVQPDTIGGLTGLDPRTHAALAEHIVREIGSY